ncbi:type 1 fimbrial protein (plasmid) [Klebsiella aerogenes]|uniref:fimbrial protein n=1 Tax=Klebsiella aerogenes TaxID=548 RepID=UPI00124C2102|nr:fimbrial protein [Klebsiella aerogenes]QFI19941.1 type 1 fimbrial protein [Klebsiella aerogenes]
MCKINLLTWYEFSKKNLLVKLMMMVVGAFLIPDLNAACRPYVEGGGTPSPIKYETISGTISVPNDLPVGTILYTGVNNRPQPNIGATCDSAGVFYHKQLLETSLTQSGYVAGTPPFSHISGSAPIYKTNVPGIGVTVNSNLTTTITTTKECRSGEYSKCYLLPTTTANHKVLLVKIGDVSPGVINGEQIPVFRWYLGQTGQWVEVLKRIFNGQIAITVPTCRTPDVTVPMGTWQVSEFTGKGKATEWKDASIIMNDCGQFVGYAAEHNTGYGLTTNYTPPTIKNRWELTLSPQNGTHDAVNGIINLSDGTQQSATGIGIQLGYGSTSSAGSNLVNFNQSKSEILPTTGTRTITIPLAARYIQTKDTITPGRADGKIIFTILYK